MTTSESKRQHEALGLRHSVTSSLHHLPIGVFDSGVGGLTVLRALREQLPSETFLYLGDTARLPYGTKSAQSVTRYSLQAADLLVRRGIKYLVVACNTASAVALEALRERYAPLPVLGVIEPGAEAACRASRTHQIAVIATEGTIRGGAYHRAITQRNSSAAVFGQACSLFVALAEEGWTTGVIVEAVARRYLDPLFERYPSIDTLLLGCTHFPVLASALRAVLRQDVQLVDSARTTALVLHQALKSCDLLSFEGQPRSIRMLATDNATRFAQVGSLFLGEPFSSGDVEIVDLAQAPEAPLK